MRTTKTVLASLFGLKTPVKERELHFCLKRSTAHHKKVHHIFLQIKLENFSNETKSKKNEKFSVNCWKKYFAAFKANQFFWQEFIFFRIIFRQNSAFYSYPLISILFLNLTNFLSCSILSSNSGYHLFLLFIYF